MMNNLKNNSKAQKNAWVPGGGSQAKGGPSKEELGKTKKLFY
jgi:hypothetical protein